jgi:hypothetical protein
MESACSVMAAPIVRRPPKTPASVLAFAMQRRGLGDPPPDDTICGWLKNRPHRLAWAISNRPEECLALGLLERPLPRVLADLRHTTLPLDPRSETALKTCLALSGVTKEEANRALADRAHLLQTVLGLLEAEP